MRDVRAIVGRSLAFVAVVTEITESKYMCSRVVRGNRIHEFKTCHGLA
jgi:hypothetical protein